MSEALSSSVVSTFLWSPLLPVGRTKAGSWPRQCSGMGGGGRDVHSAASEKRHTAAGPRQCQDSRDHLCVHAVSLPVRGDAPIGVQQTRDPGVTGKQVAIGDSVCSCGCHWSGVLWYKICLE